MGFSRRKPNPSGAAIPLATFYPPLTVSGYLSYADYMGNETNRVTLESLARTMQEEFLNLRSEVATKKNLETLETNLASIISELPTRVELKELFHLDQRVADLEQWKTRVSQKLHRA